MAAEIQTKLGMACARVERGLKLCHIIRRPQRDQQLEKLRERNTPYVRNKSFVTSLSECLGIALCTHTQRLLEDAYIIAWDSDSCLDSEVVITNVRQASFQKPRKLTCSCLRKEHSTRAGTPTVYVGGKHDTSFFLRMKATGAELPNLQF